MSTVEYDLPCQTTKQKYENTGECIIDTAKGTKIPKCVSHTYVHTNTCRAHTHAHEKHKYWGQMNSIYLTLTVVCQ